MKRLLPFLILVLWSLPAWGHSSSKSYLRLALGDEQTTGELQVALRDLDRVGDFDRNGDGKVEEAEVTALSERVADFALGQLELERSERLCALVPGNPGVVGPDLVVAFVAECSEASGPLRLRYDLFMDTDSTHQGHFSLTHSGETASFVFTSKNRVRTFAPRTEASPWTAPLREYVPEGVVHIWMGFDHILFLLTLLLPVVLVLGREGWTAAPHFRTVLKEAVKVVTAFTIAHSITLTLAALGIVNLPERLIECVIAASVVLAAANNVWPVVKGRGWVIAFVFGLVHGFGFANVLSDLGLPKGQLLLALLGFNLGVEFGQLTIVALFLPATFFLRTTKLYEPMFLRAGSGAIAVLGSVWLVERALDVSATAALVSAMASPIVGWGVATLGAVGLAGAASTAIVRRTRLSASRSLHRWPSWLAWASAGLLVVGILLVRQAERQWRTDCNAGVERLTAGRWAVAEHGVFDDAMTEGVLSRALAEALETVEAESGRNAIRRLLLHRDGRAAELGLRDRAQRVRTDTQQLALAERQLAVVVSLGNVSLAAETYESSIEADPTALGTHQELGLLLGRAGRLDPAKQSFERLLARAEAAGQREFLALARERIGEILSAQEKWSEAEASLLAALEECEALGDASAQARLRRKLAEVHIRRGAWSEALPALTASRDIASRAGDNPTLASTLTRLGDLHVAAGERAQADDMYHEALRIREQLGDRTGQAALYRNLAVAALLGRDGSEAARMYRRSLELHEQLGLEAESAKDYEALGNVYDKNGEHGEAIRMLERARLAYAAAKKPRGLAAVSAGLGNVYQKQEDFEAAARMYREVVRASDELGETPELANSLANLGNVYKSQGDLPKAREMYAKSLELFRKYGETRKASRVETYMDLLDALALNEATHSVAGARRPSGGAVSTGR